MNILSPNQYIILAILGENPEREFHFNELGRFIGKRPGVFQRGINALEKRGMIISRRQGNMRMFRINTRYPLHTEMMALVRKTYGLEAALGKAVAGIDGIKIALIYGSYAKDKMRADSDVDLLIVVDNPEAEDSLIERLEIIEKSTLREINYRIYSESDFLKERRANNPFLAEVLSDAYIVLKGQI